MEGRQGQGRVAGSDGSHPRQEGPGAARRDLGREDRGYGGHEAHHYRREQHYLAPQRVQEIGGITMRGSIPALAAVLLAFPALAERLPLQNDFDRCAIAMVNSGAAGDLQGQLRMELMIRRDGKVYAAFVSSEKG